MAELTGADLAVVIPTRDRWDILELTLSSLAHQSVSGFETIVVVDGTDQDVPPLEAGSVIVKRRAGPAAARNAGARSTERPIVMYLGDDTIPAPDLVERHLATHRRHPEREAAAVGFVAWHDTVSHNKINAWLEWSGTQSWYDALATEGEQEVSHWHFYTSNVSLKRELLLEGGGFDEDFPFAAFEDIECAIRLSELGLRLYYEPSAICRHLHDYDWPGLQRRFVSMAVSERLMVDMHPEVAPGCLNRMKQATSRRALPTEGLVGSLPTRLRPLDKVVRQQANRHYHRRLAPAYIAAWDRAAELCELRRYLGDRYDSARLVYGSPPLGEVPEHAQTPAEDRLFALARHALSGEASETHSELLRHLPPRGKLLDYGCGVGAAGLRLVQSGFSVQFADDPGLPLDYLRWRLAERRIPGAVYEFGADALPGDFDAAFCLDASESGRQPEEVLRQLQELAPIVVLRVGSGSDAATFRNGAAAEHALPDGSLLLVYRRQQSNMNTQD